MPVPPHCKYITFPVEYEIACAVGLLNQYIEFHEFQLELHSDHEPYQFHAPAVIFINFGLNHSHVIDCDHVPHEARTKNQSEKFHADHLTSLPSSNCSFVSPGEYTSV